MLNLSSEDLPKDTRPILLDRSQMQELIFEEMNRCLNRTRIPSGTEGRVLPWPEPDAVVDIPAVLADPAWRVEYLGVGAGADGRGHDGPRWPTSLVRSNILIDAFRDSVRAAVFDAIETLNRLQQNGKWVAAAWELKTGYSLARERKPYESQGEVRYQLGNGQSIRLPAEMQDRLRTEDNEVKVETYLLNVAFVDVMFAPEWVDNLELAYPEHKDGSMAGGRIPMPLRQRIALGRDLLQRWADHHGLKHLAPVVMPAKPKKPRKPRVVKQIASAESAP